jgi:four helix bundle protein
MSYFRSLEVWQKAHSMALAVYRRTEGFPRPEQFGLAGQMRRAVTSVPSNIAEGCGQGTRQAYARYLQLAIGSCNELEYQLLLARDLEYLDSEDQGALALEVSRVRQMLSRLVHRMRAGQR